MTARLRAVWFVCVLTAAGLIPTSAQQEVKYVKLGGPFEVLPNITLITKPITGIMWKHGPNKAAEWDKLDPQVDYYGTYVNRTLLDKKTVKLVVQNMSINDGGIYSVEINGRMQGQTFKIEFIVDVPKPKVDLKPLSCAADSPHCFLVCEGNITGAGPVTYRWKKMKVNGEVKMDDSEQLTIFNNEEGKTIKTFSCEMKNPVGEMLSEPYENLFYVDPTSSIPVAVGAFFGVVGGLLLLLLVGCLIGVKESNTFKNRISPTVRDRFPGPLRRCFFFLFPEVTAGATTVDVDVDKGNGPNGVTEGATTVHVDVDKGNGPNGVTAGATTVHVDGDTPLLQNTFNDDPQAKDGEGNGPNGDTCSSGTDPSNPEAIREDQSSSPAVGDKGKVKMLVERLEDASEKVPLLQNTFNDDPQAKDGEGNGPNGVIAPLIDVPTPTASSDSAPVAAVGDGDTAGEGNGGGHS